MPEAALGRGEEIKNLDRHGMAELLTHFPEQVEEAIRIGESFPVPRALGRGIEKIIFVGMGGSAIGGDIIRSLTASDSSIPVWVWRHYELPPFVDSKTLCIFSSYSGNTEETLSAFEKGRKKGLKGLIITSGGELARLGERFSIPWLRIPTGFPPRAALGYSVFPILRVLSKLGLGKWDSRGVAETLSCLRALGKKYAVDSSIESNPAKQMAHSLAGRWVVIYAGAELLDSAALRFRNQIEENAKAMASHHLVPEMNHNEILGWQFPAKLIRESACVFLRDSMDHKRIQLRMEFTKEHIAKQGVPVFEIFSQGKSRSARLFSTLYLGDWISFYLAILYGIDPTPVAVIESLKKQLAKVRA